MILDRDGDSIEVKRSEKNTDLVIQVRERGVLSAVILDADKVQEFIDLLQFELNHLKSEK